MEGLGVLAVRRPRDKKVVGVFVCVSCAASAEAWHLNNSTNKIDFKSLLDG
jgi:hypothetical protein